MSLTCTKRFTDIPFAHRQPAHPGHCAQIHGHGWSIEVTFACVKKDENGFIIDFGKLGFLKSWIEEHLDHAFLVCGSDPALADFKKLEAKNLFKLTEVEDCSAEGLAQYFFKTFNYLTQRETEGRVYLTRCTVFEDSRNSATYEP